MGVLFAHRLRHQGGKDIPPTPTNADRIRAYREVAPMELGNTRRWKWHAARYAMEAVPSSEAEYGNQMREGAAFKYGDKA